MHSIVLIMFWFIYPTVYKIMYVLTQPVCMQIFICVCVRIGCWYTSTYCLAAIPVILHGVLVARCGFHGHLPGSGAAWAHKQHHSLSNRVSNTRKGSWKYKETSTRNIRAGVPFLTQAMLFLGSIVGSLNFTQLHHKFMAVVQEFLRSLSLAMEILHIHQYLGPGVYSWPAQS